MRGFIFPLLAAVLTILVVNGGAKTEDDSGLGFLDPGYSGARDSGESQARPSEDTKSSRSPPKRRYFKGFGAYRSRFSELCEYIQRDGQRDWYAETLKDGARHERECRPCRSLYLVMSSGCPILKRKLSKTSQVEQSEEQSKADESENAQENNEEKEVQDTAGLENGKGGEEVNPQETPQPRHVRYYEPNLLAVNLVLEAAREMAEDEEAAEDNLIAIRHLAAKMRDEANKDNSEKSYFDILASFFLEPFRVRGLLDGAQGGPDSAAQPQPTPVNVDALFEF